MSFNDDFVYSSISHVSFLLNPLVYDGLQVSKYPDEMYMGIVLIYQVWKIVFSQSHSNDFSKQIYFHYNHG